MIDGRWIAFSKYSSNAKDIIISGDEISFSQRERKSDEYRTYTTKFELCERKYMLRGEECYELVVPDGLYIKPEYYVHKETIGEREVYILSEMCFEYDGRGLIVWTSFIREEDRDLVDENFESLLYKTCNRRQAPPMSKQPEMPQMGMGGFVGMAAVMGQMPNQMPFPTATGKPGKPWDCSCGAKGSTGKFCPECGAPRVDLQE